MAYKIMHSLKKVDRQIFFSPQNTGTCGFPVKLMGKIMNLLCITGLSNYLTES